MRSLTVVFLAALAACEAPVGVDLPLQPGDRSLLLVVRRANGSHWVEAQRLEGELPAFRLLDSEVGYLLVYPFDLEAIGLEEGQVDALSVGGRQLPASARVAVRLQPSGTQVRPVLEVLEELAEVRIPDLNFAACASVGGCGVRAGTEERAECRIPCPVQPSIRPPVPPTLPAPVRSGDCPAGWTESEAFACVPPVECADRQVRKSTGVCGPPGPACPSARFAEAPPGRRPWFVDPSSPDGDGSQAQPFPRVNEALARASDGDVILLSRGEHPGFEIDRSVHVLGPCTDQASTGPVRIRRGQVVLSGFRIEGSGLAAGLVVSSPATSVRVEGVEILQGVSASGAGVLELREVIVHGGRVGLAVLSRTLDAERVSVRGTTEVAVLGRDLGLSSRVADIRLRSEMGVGLSLEGGSLQLERAAIDGFQSAGVRIADAALTGTHVVVRDVSRFGSAGIEANRSALRLGRSWAARNPVGILASDSTLDLTDVVLSDMTGGNGMTVSQGELVGRRVRVLRSSEFGVYINGTQTFEIEDLDIRDCRPDSDDRKGDGLVVRDTVGTVRRVAIRRCENFGVAVFGLPAPGRLTLVDATVEDVAQNRRAVLSVGLDVREGGFLSVERARVQRVDGPAIRGYRANRVFLDDIDLSRTEIGLRLDQLRGSLNRVRVRDVVGTGLYVLGANIDGRDLEINGVARDLSDQARGVLIVGFQNTTSVSPGILNLTNFAIRGASEACFRVELFTETLRLTEGFVDDCGIGLDVQVLMSAFSLDDIGDRLAFGGNVVDGFRRGL